MLLIYSLLASPSSSKDCVTMCFNISRYNLCLMKLAQLFVSVRISFQNTSYIIVLVSDKYYIRFAKYICTYLSYMLHTCVCPLSLQYAAVVLHTSGYL